jgi:hypothetical protein
MYTLTNEDIRDGSLTSFLAKVILNVKAILALVKSGHAKSVLSSQIMHEMIGIRTRISSPSSLQPDSSR